VPLLAYQNFLNVQGTSLAVNAPQQITPAELVKVVIRMDVLVRLPVYQSSLNAQETS
jgi:hypothetical protein